MCISNSAKRVESRRAPWEHKSEQRGSWYRLEEKQFLKLGSCTPGGMPGTVLEFNGRAIPAVDLDQFLQGLFAVLNANATERPSIFYLAHVLWRHRRTQGVVTPPKAIQQILFPVVLLIGRILGKYKGQGWPGCPEACTGAPLSEEVIA